MVKSNHHIANINIVLVVAVFAIGFMFYTSYAPDSNTLVDDSIEESSALVGQGISKGQIINSKSNSPSKSSSSSTKVNVVSYSKNTNYQINNKNNVPTNNRNVVGDQFSGTDTPGSSSSSSTTIDFPLLPKTLGGTTALEADIIGSECISSNLYGGNQVIEREYDSGSVTTVNGVNDGYTYGFDNYYCTIGLFESEGIRVSENHRDHPPSVSVQYSNVYSMIQDTNVVSIKPVFENDLELKGVNCQYGIAILKDKTPLEDISKYSASSSTNEDSRQFDLSEYGLVHYLDGTVTDDEILISGYREDMSQSYSFSNFVYHTEIILEKDFTYQFAFFANAPHNGGFCKVPKVEKFIYYVE